MIDQDVSGQSNAPSLTVESRADGAYLLLAGSWTINSARSADIVISSFLDDPVRPTGMDLGGVTELDTAGAWLIEKLGRTSGCDRTTVVNVAPLHQILLDAVLQAGVQQTAEYKQQTRWSDFPEEVGRNIVDVIYDIRLLFDLLGATVVGLFSSLLQISKFRGVSMIHQIDRTGLQAVPIIALMSFLIGGIVAQQGAFQLRTFGAEIFVIDLVGVLLLREIGVLLTAIMVAGRSGSAFTAELGSMKMREEIDALKVGGLSPVEVLVVPRVLALVISLPLTTIVSNFSGLAGACLVAWVYSGIEPEAFVAYLREAIALNTFLVGIIKAPFMALIIALVACSEGLQVSGSAESLGRRTTASVVKSIFLVIVVDGIFAIFFGLVGF